AQTTSRSSEEHALIESNHFDLLYSIAKKKSPILSPFCTKLFVAPCSKSIETYVATYLSSENNDDTVKSKLAEAHNCIVETLTQSLFTLDEVICPPEFETARQKRREAVKFTQGLIDR
ncbi:12510_t:CDS:2, partial [Gigaspora rosea]